MRTLLVLLNPFAPHLTSELWESWHQKFGGGAATSPRRPGPVYDERFLVEDEIEIVVQVNGKLRDKITVALDATRAGDGGGGAAPTPKCRNCLAGKTIRKVVVVPKKLVNIVAG